MPLFLVRSRKRRKIWRHATLTTRTRIHAHVKAEDSLQAAQEALTRGDVEASTRFRATAAQEFDLAGADRSSELAQLGGRIAESGKGSG